MMSCASPSQLTALTSIGALPRDMSGRIVFEAQLASPTTTSRPSSKRLAGGLDPADATVPGVQSGDVESGTSAPGVAGAAAGVAIASGVTVASGIAGAPRLGVASGAGVWIGAGLSSG